MKWKASASSGATAKNAFCGTHFTSLEAMPYVKKCWNHSVRFTKPSPFSSVFDKGHYEKAKQNAEFYTEQKQLTVATSVSFVPFLTCSTH